MATSFSFRHLAIILIICLTASYAIVSGHLHFFSYSNHGGNTDALKYLAMYKGEPVEGHWRFRVLVPYIARVLPNPPPVLFDARRAIDDLWIAKIKFGFINLLFLAATGVILFYFLSGVGLSLLESLMGVLFFYTAQPVVQNAGIPLVDTASYFFLLFCFYALQHQSLTILAAVFSMGIFVKETILLVFPAILLSQSRHKIRAMLSLMPALVAYLVFRFYVYPDAGENYFNTQLIPYFKDQLLAMARFNKMLNLFSSFGLLWIPALYALTLSETPLLLKRWAWLILFLLVVIFLLRGGFGFMLFLIFPVVIPLAAYGIRSILKLYLVSKCGERNNEGNGMA